MGVAEGQDLRAKYRVAQKKKCLAPSHTEFKSPIQCRQGVEQEYYLKSSTILSPSGLREEIGPYLRMDRANSSRQEPVTRAHAKV